MTIISSQYYIDYSIVDAKEETLVAEGAKSVSIPCCYAGEIDGEEYSVQIDGHHTLTAARRLGLEIVYDIINHPEGVTGETLLDVTYADGDWYNVETSDHETYRYDIVW